MAKTSHPWLLAPLLAMIAGPAQAATCSARSGPERAVVVELYTSEGCNSCPPADRWLSRLKSPGDGKRPLLPLAFHVDYWDRLGWRDRFASPRFSARQKQRGALAGAGFVYTPQVLVDGRDFRSWYRLADPSSAAGAEPPAAAIALDAETQPGGVLRVALAARVTAPAGDAVAWLALIEDGLVNEVRAGENAGRRLTHDHVVREWVGPLPFAADGRLEIRHEFRRPDVVAGNSRLTALVESASAGAALQALALQSCREAPPAR